MHLNDHNHYFISTTQGNISIWDSQGKGDPVVFIHANSACKEAFRYQFESELTKKYRFIALDLSGHGKSDKAKDPEKTYNVEGHAKVVAEVIAQLHLNKPVVVGWSLGGHIGLNLIQNAQKLAGLLITGTPPIKMSPEGFDQGFSLSPELARLFSKIDFSRAEAAEFMQAGGFDTDKHPFIAEAAFKTDGYARYFLCEANMKGIGGDQRAIVETDPTPLCVVQGKKEISIKNPYIQSIQYKNLFDKVYIIEDAGHAVFWDQPQRFNEILENFLKFIER